MVGIVDMEGILNMEGNVDMVDMNDMEDVMNQTEDGYGGHGEVPGVGPEEDPGGDDLPDALRPGGVEPRGPGDIMEMETASRLHQDAPALVRPLSKTSGYNLKFVQGISKKNLLLKV